MSDFENDTGEELKPGDEDLQTALKDFPDIAKAIDRRVTKAISTFKERHNISDDNKSTLPTKAEELAQREAVLELKESAIMQAVQKGVSPALAVKMIGRDQEETDKNLNELFSEIGKGYERAGKEFVSKNNYIPQAGSAESVVFNRYRMLNEKGYYSKCVKLYGQDKVQEFIKSSGIDDEAIRASHRMGRM